MVETFYRISGAPFLALLSDLHNRPYEQVIASIASRKPDLLCITGDCIYGNHPGDTSPLVSQSNVLPFLSACAELAPTYLSLGNHEWALDDADLDEIRGTGVVVLDNEWVVKDGLVIGGLTSGYVLDYRRFLATLSSEERAAERYPKKPDVSGIGGLVTTHEPDTAWLDAYCSVPGYHVLLSHHPELWPRIREKSIELCVSGHVHGGQIRIFNHGLFSPNQGFWPKYTKGVYDGRLVVSAGLANTAKIPRFFNPTETVYIQGS